MNSGKSKRILFLTTHNLATNPRLFKEVLLAIKFGYQPEVICFEFDNWSKLLNEQLKKQLGTVKVISIPAGRNPFFPWARSVFTELFFRKLGRYFSLPASALSLAVSRRSGLLIKALDKVSMPDWVIGHNPGALWPAVKAAKKFNCKVAFDVEDYHPGEGNDKHLQNLTRQLMTKLLLTVNYVSFASPLILQNVKRDIDSPNANWFTVLNYFPIADFLQPANFFDKEVPLTMVWFSQNIDADRGLELILPLMQKLAEKAELHLIGNLQAKFYEQKLKNISNIIIHAPLKQTQLHQSLANFDIGLALEPAKDRNNELAISNKILAYLQAGMFVLATNTKAQEAFLNELPQHGLCFDYQENNAGAILEKIILKIDTIRENKLARYNAMKNRNWESVSLVLLKEWQKND